MSLVHCLHVLFGTDPMALPFQTLYFKIILTYHPCIDIKFLWRREVKDIHTLFLDYIVSQNISWRFCWQNWVQGKAIGLWVCIFVGTNDNIVAIEHQALLPCTQMLCWVIEETPFHRRGTEASYKSQGTVWIALQIPCLGSFSKNDLIAVLFVLIGEDGYLAPVRLKP